MTDAIEATERPRVRVAAGSSLRNNLQGTVSFAHLSGVAAATRADDDDDDTEAREGEDDADGKRGKKGEKKGKAKTRKARGDDSKDDDDDDKSDDDGGEDDEDEDGDDESDDEEMTGKKGKGKKAARARERARCRAIFASPHAAGKAGLAAHFAFNTKMTRGEAIAALKASPAEAQSGGYEAAMRQAGARSVPVDAGGERGGSQAISAGWDKAFSKVVQPARR